MSALDPYPAPPEHHDASRLYRLGRLLAARRRTVLVMAALVTVLAGVFGAGAMNALSLSRFESPGAESVRADALLHERFGTGSPNLLLLVTAKTGTVDSPEVAQAGRALTTELSGQAEVADAGSYWTYDSSPALRSKDGTRALVVAWLPGSATEARETLADLSPRFTRDSGPITVAVGGQDEVFRQVATQARTDFIRAEVVVLPVVFLLLLWVYRRLSAALLTIGVGLFAMLTTLALLRVITLFTEVSTFAANLTLVLGLGLGIDYSLFVIFRFREELARGRDVASAVARATQTAGRTVVFSGVTVAASLAVLLALPFPFLRSFAYAGVLVVATSVLGAVMVLPAALAGLGARVARRGVTAATGLERGRWYRLALGVMRRPLLTGGAAVGILLLLGAPFLGVRFGLPDERILPADATSRLVQEHIRADFAVEQSDAIQVVAEDLADPATREADVASYAARLSRLPGVFQVDSRAGSFSGGEQVRPPTDRFDAERGTWLSVIPTTAALDGDVPALVRSVRAVETPFPVLVGGFPADMTDFRDRLLNRLPLVIALVLAVTFVILFLMSGSLLIPVKATVLNVLSLSVLFGALVWVFQDGHGAGLIGFTATGRMEPSIPILMFCVAYGLSMDYEVFMISRIREEYDRTGDLVRSVATGIQRGAPLITAAAGIMALTFAAYATGRVGFLQMLGVSMALAVLVDATLIRAVLMPAFMRLAGTANWWAPGPLRRLHRRIGLSESESAAVPATSPKPMARLSPAARIDE
ncbi:MMPL family transporter [Micromonospora sp. DT201]|uniref:MMPL family transporter n=1 Tax=Micromonospora sp. DT201 TaxID=3393442 RepID=UPI003CF2CCFA